MSRVQLDLLHARRLVYIGKYKDSRTRNIMHNNNTIATTPTDDLPRLASQEDLLSAVFLDAGETLLPDHPCASVGGGTQQQQSQQPEQEQEQEYLTSWKSADFVEHTKVQSAAQAMATTERAPSGYPLSSSSTSHSSEETRAMPSSTTTTTTAGPKSSANFCPKEADDSCTADEDGGHVSLTSCAIILLSLGLRAIRRLIHSYQNNILSMQESATPPKTSSPFRLRSESKAVTNDNKARTQTDSSVSAADQQFDFYDTEEEAHHPAEDATTVIPEVATVAAAAAEEDATIATGEEDATIAAAEEDTTVVAGAQDDATTVVEDSMTDLEGTSSCKTTNTQLQQQKTEDPDQVQLLVEEQQSEESSEKAFLQGRNSYSRTHSMLTVHTPDHRGFLGLPKTSLPGGGANAQQVGGLKQVPERRVGSNLSHTTTSKPPHSRMSSSKTQEFITQAGAGAGAGAGATHNNQTGLLPPWTTTTRAATATTSSKEVPIAKQIAKEAVLARVLVPPPSPLPPSESWFAATTSFRKPLGSFIREKHAGFIRKSSASHQDQIPTVTQPSNNNNNSSSSSSSSNSSSNNNNNNNNNNNSQWICSSKDLLQRRQSFRPTIHAI